MKFMFLSAPTHMTIVAIGRDLRCRLVYDNFYKNDLTDTNTCLEPGGQRPMGGGQPVFNDRAHRPVPKPVRLGTDFPTDDQREWDGGDCRASIQ